MRVNNLQCVFVVSSEVPTTKAVVGGPAGPAIAGLTTFSATKISFYYSLLLVRFLA